MSHLTYEQLLDAADQEHLDVTETFLKDALDAYLLKYGKCTVIDNYMIFFEPLGVVDMNYGIE